MAVEANLEYLHDIYQPCLPHILEALNNQPNITSLSCRYSRLASTAIGFTPHTVPVILFSV
jgi:hypothetical protein